MGVLTKPIFWKPAAGGGGAPTLVAYSQSTLDAVYDNGNAIAVGSSFSWVAGDVVVAFWGYENTGGSYYVTMDNETNLTFSAVSTRVGVVNELCDAQMFTAVATGSGSGTISGVVTAVSGSQAFQLGAWHFTDTDGIGNTVGATETATGAGNTAPSTPTLTLTASANSAVVTAWFDFNASAGPWTGETNTGTFTERLDNQHSGRFSMWAGDWVGVSAGSDDWGVTSGTGLVLTWPGVVEVLGTT